ncbi:MAG: hypothetical protein ACI4GW_11865 [Lachnospiraceae bacterium]
MEQFTTIRELDPPVKVTRFLYFYDLLFIGTYTFISYKILVNHIYSKFQILYLINCLLWGVFFIWPAVGNGKRKNWQNILNTLLNMNTGKIYYSEKETDDEDI